MTNNSVNSNEQSMLQNRKYKVWIYTIISMVLLMVVVGGITRLTGSGLSIVEWQPVVGAVPPLSDSAWQEVFNKYQQSPQFQLVNHAMTLSEFKFIFFWEFIHRLIGRLIGFVIILPMIFWWRKMTPVFKKKMFFAILLGGLQGVIGWYMVKSGLINEPRVSHYRLATHLVAALLILNYLVWVLQTELKQKKLNSLLKFDLIILLLLFVQIIYGAFTAGLKAGHLYNEFPMMGAGFFPDGFLGLSPWFHNFLENPAAIQWFHRWLGISILAVSIFEIAKHYSLKAKVFFLLVTTQVIFGITTLLFHVPISTAVMHQFFAFLLFMVRFAFVFDGNSQKIIATSKI